MNETTSDSTLDSNEPNEGDLALRNDCGMVREIETRY